MKKYFINAHTSEGFKSLLHQFWDDYQIWIVTGGSVQLKGNFLAELTKIFIAQKQNFHLFLHPTDGEALEGILLYEKNLLIIADHSPMFLWSKYRGIFQKTINLNDCLNSSLLQGASSQIKALIDELEGERREAYACFAKGKSIHEEKESLSKKGIDFQKVNRITEDMINQWLGKDFSPSNEVPIPKQVFFGSSSIFGPINVIDELTEGLEHRIIMKGKSGSGKSTFMRKFAKEAEKKKLSVQYFPCALDPQSIDMIVLPDLSMAIVDGTMPHVVEPTREGDITLSLSEQSEVSGERIDEEKLSVIMKKYKQVMKKGTEHLHNSYKIELRLDDIFNQALLKGRFDKLVKEVGNEKIG